MTLKRLSLRFNLDREDDRKAWEAIHRMDAQTVNKEIIARINAKEQAEGLTALIRQAISEELSRLSGSISAFQPVQQENSAEEIEDMFNFLDSF